MPFLGSCRDHGLNVARRPRRPPSTETVDFTRRLVAGELLMAITTTSMAKLAAPLSRTSDRRPRGRPRSALGRA